MRMPHKCNIWLSRVWPSTNTSSDVAKLCIANRILSFGPCILKYRPEIGYDNKIYTHILLTVKTLIDYLPWKIPEDQKPISLVWQLTAPNVTVSTTFHVLISYSSYLSILLPALTWGLANSAPWIWSAICLSHTQVLRERNIIIAWFAACQLVTLSNSNEDCATILWKSKSTWIHQTHVQNGFKLPCL